MPKARRLPCEAPRAVRKRLTVLGVCLLMALVACGPTYHIALKPEHAAAITSTHVHATIAQEEVEAAVKAANTPIYNAGLVGALVGAIIDTAVTSHRAGKAGELLEPIRKEASDFDFRDAFFTSLQQTLPSLNVLRTANLTTSKLPLTPDRWATIRARTPENTLLSLTTRYELSSDFKTFSVMTRAEISRPGPKRRDQEEEPLYLGTFQYDSAPIVTSGGPEEAARAWAANNAEALRAAMLEGIEETMKMLAMDLGAPGGARAPANAALAATSVSSPAPVQTSRPRARRLIRRQSNGIMYSAPPGGYAVVSSNQ